MITFKQFLSELHKPKEIQMFISYIQSGADVPSGDGDVHPGDPSYSITHADKLFKKYQFKSLGQGFYAKIYGKNDFNYVIKIWNSAEDAGYNSYLKFCLNNQSNKYVPQVKGRPTKIPRTPYSYVRLEKLYPVGYSLWLQFMTRLGKVKQGEIHDKDLKLIADFTSNFHEDIHDENIMQRQNGQIVVTDPII